MGRGCQQQQGVGHRGRLIHRSNYFTFQPTFVKALLCFPGSSESSSQQNLPRASQSTRSISTMVGVTRASGRTFAFLHIRWETETANIRFAECVSNFKGKGEKKHISPCLCLLGFVRNRDALNQFQSCNWGKPHPFY